jgi:hypothetical protein
VAVRVAAPRTRDRHNSRLVDPARLVETAAHEWWRACAIAVSAATVLVSPAAAADNRKVVVVVWDGMRPDMVTEENSPTLWKLRQEGVWFANHHSVYPTVTQVNGTAIAIGAYPDRTGLIGNREYRPAIRAEKIIDTAVQELVQQGDEISGGKYLALPTVAEQVRAAGRSAVVAGSKSVAQLHDRNAEWTSARRNELATVFAAAPMPPALREEAERRFGPLLVRPTDKNAERNAYTTRAMVELLWRDGVRTFPSCGSASRISHNTRLPPARRSRWLRSGTRMTISPASSTRSNPRAGARQLMCSWYRITGSPPSHAPSMCRASSPMRASTRSSTSTSHRSRAEIMVAGNAGSTFFYVIGRDPAITRRLVEALQRSDFAGVIFTREKMEGTFELKTARLGREGAPDVIVAMRWSDGKNRFGVPGELVADATRAVGNGTHASLSRHDVHNTLVAAGPSFRRGATIAMPSGNIDIAPTVLHLLRIQPAEKLDGRVLAEAFTDGKEDPSR